MGSNGTRTAPPAGARQAPPASPRDVPIRISAQAREHRRAVTRRDPRGCPRQCRPSTRPIWLRRRL